MRLRLAAIAALLCCAAATPARAGMSSYSASFRIAPSGGGAGTEDLLLSQFDPRPFGPLESVEIQLQYYAGSPHLDESATFAGAGGFSGTLGADLSASYAGLVATASPSVSGSFAGPGSLSGPDWSVFGATITAGMTPFVGTGLIVFSLSDAPFVAATGGATATLTAAGAWSGTLALTYTYASAPEPGSWAMMAAGMVGIGWGARRRRYAKTECLSDRRPGWPA